MRDMHLSEPILDIKGRIQQYIPALIELLGNETISWGRITNQFKKIFESRKQKYIANNNYLEIEASLYDIIIATINGNKQAEILFIFFNRLIEELIQFVPREHIGKLKKTVYDLLTNFDKNYLNFIGELAILNNLLKSGNYFLEDIEYPLGNGNSIDFKFYNISSAKSVLIEVVNIHPKQDLPDSFHDINAFLSKRINDKVLNKKKNLNVSIEFILTPVIWAPIKDLYRIYNFLKAGEHLSIMSSIEPSAYACFHDENGRVNYKFGRVSTLFDK